MAERIVRYVPSKQPYDAPRAGWWYVTDLLTGESAIPDWFRSEKTAQRAADKMNRSPDELNRNYVRLTNGFVAVAHGFSRETGFRIGEKDAEAMRPLEVEYAEKHRYR